MSKPPNIIRPIKVHITLPEDLKLKLDLILYSESERRVPHGAYARFFEARVQEYLDRIANAQVTNT